MADDELDGPRFCRDCGYDLRALPPGECPECGGPFDPADPRTVTSRPTSRPGRALMRPAGWAWALTAAAGLLAIAAVTSLKGLSGEPVAVEAVGSAAALLRLEFSTPFNGRSALLGAGVLVTTTTAAALVLRVAAGLALIHRHGRSRRPARPAPIVTALALLLAAGGLAVFGWKGRLARMWAQEQIAQANSRGVWISPEFSAELRTEQHVAIIVWGAEHLPTPRLRTAAIKLLAERTERPLPHLLDLAGREKDADVAAALLRLAGLHREREAIGRIATFLDDERPAVRAAATDALALTWSDTLERPALILATDPPIVAPEGWWKPLFDPILDDEPKPPAMEEKLRRMMTSDSDAGVRWSAARPRWRCAALPSRSASRRGACGTLTPRATTSPRRRPACRRPSCGRTWTRPGQRRRPAAWWCSSAHPRRRRCC